MSGHEFKMVWQPRPEGPILSREEVVNKVFAIYKDRREDEMDWRVKSLLARAYYEGFRAGKASE